MPTRDEVACGDNMEGVGLIPLGGPVVSCNGTLKISVCVPM